MFKIVILFSFLTSEWHCNGLVCADVPLRNYSPTHSLTSNTAALMTSLYNPSTRCAFVWQRHNDNTKL